MKVKDIMDLMVRAKELGIPIKVGNIEIGVMQLSTDDNKKPVTVPDLPADKIVKPLSVLDQFTDEEILFYSTSRFEDLLAEKEAQKERIKEEIHNG